ncbi:hypothetical protein CRYUN_Cryun01aG0170500 [Craigia yunnanensis]
MPRKAKEAQNSLAAAALVLEAAGTHKRPLTTHIAGSNQSQQEPNGSHKNSLIENQIISYDEFSREREILLNLEMRLRKYFLLY